MNSTEELAPPPRINEAERAMEIARLWIVDKNLQVVLNTCLWSDPGAWGLLLVDLARHVSKAYEGQGKDGEEVLTRILDAFNAELRHPTDEPEELHR